MGDARTSEIKVDPETQDIVAKIKDTYKQRKIPIVNLMSVKNEIKN